MSRSVKIPPAAVRAVPPIWIPLVDRVLCAGVTPQRSLCTFGGAVRAVARKG